LPSRRAQIQEAERTSLLLKPLAPFLGWRFASPFLNLPSDIINIVGFTVDQVGSRATVEIFATLFFGVQRERPPYAALPVLARTTPPSVAGPNPWLKRTSS
jgi:hypothetical protein